MWGVDIAQRVHVFRDDFDGKLRLAEIDPLQRLAQMRASRANGVDAAIVDPFDTVQLNRRVVDGIKMEPQQGHGHLAGKAIGQIVD